MSKKDLINSDDFKAYESCIRDVLTRKIGELRAILSAGDSINMDMLARVIKCYAEISTLERIMQIPYLRADEFGVKDMTKKINNDISNIWLNEITGG